MSFLRPELAARLGAGASRWSGRRCSALGVWLAWRGYGALAPLPFVVGLLLAAAGLGLLRAALRRLRLSAEAMDEGVVVIDEARIAYLGPRAGRGRRPAGGGAGRDRHPPAPAARPRATPG